MEQADDNRLRYYKGGQGALRRAHHLQVAISKWWARLRFADPTHYDRRYFPSTGSGFTLSFGGSACMVINVIETRS
jgi:hypothetical protein